MRVRELKYKLQTNPYMVELDRHLSITKEEFDARWKGFKISYTYKNSYAYIDALFRVKENNLKRYIPEYEKEVLFDYGLFEMHAYMAIRVNPYERHAGKVETILRFEVINNPKFNRLCWAKDWFLPDSLNWEDPVPQLKQMLATEIYPEGFMHSIQFAFATDKKGVPQFYRYYLRLKKEVIINEQKIFDWIEKHFNVSSDVYMSDTIAWVNKHGKQKSRIVLKYFDYNAVWECLGDGGVAELEECFWNYADEYEANVMFVN